MTLNSTQAGGKTLCLVVSLLRIFFLFPTFAHISHDLMAEHLKLWLLKRGQINVKCHVSFNHICTKSLLNTVHHCINLFCLCVFLHLTLIFTVKGFTSPKHCNFKLQTHYKQVQLPFLSFHEFELNMKKVELKCLMVM